MTDAIESAPREPRKWQATFHVTTIHTIEVDYESGDTYQEAMNKAAEVLLVELEDGKPVLSYVPTYGEDVTYRRPT